MAKKDIVSVLVKIFIFLAKLKKPITRNLLFLKKMKRLKLLDQYSYNGYVKEYEFSPSSTQLFQFRRMLRSRRIGLKKMCADLLVICRCLVGSRKREMYRLELGLDSLARIEGSSRGMMVEFSNSSSEDDECVDERAERFIQSFYQEMKRQTTDPSLLQI